MWQQVNLLLDFTINNNQVYISVNCLRSLYMLTFTTCTRTCNESFYLKIIQVDYGCMQCKMTINN